MYNMEEEEEEGDEEKEGGMGGRDSLAFMVRMCVYTYFYITVPLPCVDVTEMAVTPHMKKHKTKSKF